ncbi:MAG: 2-phospho-L-lactate transferase [Steroidobacteraceae bacterium]|nr:2-phospho-L-lactate transferase [Steroidobacteraceae bacterium]
MSGKVLALAGGIGGAKLVLGLARVLGDGELVVVGNTGDDFNHLGFSISPDLDTLLYTLAGLADRSRGWGRRRETWKFMAALEQLGGPSWFRLGDADLALHVERTRRLASGESLTSVMDHLRRELGVATRLVPMTDDPVRTRLRSGREWLDFQDYFVRLRCEPAVEEIAYVGAESARPQPEILALLGGKDLRAVVICPSNPFLSIEPILAIPGMRSAIAQCAAPVVAVSPIIAGRAVKGPTAKMMREFGIEVTATAVARHYARLIDVFVVDEADVDAEVPGEVECVTASTLMVTLADRKRLARSVLAAADAISRSR